MAKLKVRNVSVLKTESDLGEKFAFEIVFEALEAINDGSAEDESKDQVLDSVLVGPIPSGCPPPDFNLIPKGEIVGLTVIIITCHYQQQEFARIGYYVNNEYISEELRECPPEEPIISKLRRTIIASDPRVTYFQINWDKNTNLENKE